MKNLTITIIVQADTKVGTTSRVREITIPHPTAGCVIPHSRIIDPAQDAITEVWLTDQ